MYDMILGDCHKCDGNDTIRPDTSRGRVAFYKLLFRVPLMCRRCNARFSVFKLPEILSRMIYFLFH